MFCGTCAAECCTVFDSSRRLSTTLRIPCVLCCGASRGPFPKHFPVYLFPALGANKGTTTQLDQSMQCDHALGMCGCTCRRHEYVTAQSQCPLVCDGCPGGGGGATMRGARPNHQSGQHQQLFVFPQGFAGSRVTQISASARSSTRRHPCPRRAVPNSSSQAEVSTNTVVPGSTATTSGLLRVWTFRALCFQNVLLRFLRAS